MIEHNTISTSHSLEFYNPDIFFFPVGLHELYYDEERINDLNRSIRGNLFSHCGVVPVERFIAVVDEEFQNVFACVSRQYTLIENEWAYSWAERFAQSAFNAYSFDIRFIGGSFCSKDRGSCHMNIGVDREMHIKRVNHKWSGFVQMTNSYDTSKPLLYELGFKMETMDERRIQIGILIPSLSLNLRLNHNWTLETIERKLKNAIDGFSLNVFDRFRYMVDRLLSIVMDDDHILPLFCKLANIKKLDPEEPKDINLAISLYKIKEVSSYWIEKCGHNAYAALCAYAEFISENDPIQSLLNTSDSYQSVLGKFMEKLIDASIYPSFSIHDFIGKEADSVKTQIKIIVANRQSSY